MFELKPFYKTLFYLAAALLAVQVTFALSLVHSPRAGWQIYTSFLALAISVPMLLGACVAALLGYYKVLQTLLLLGGLAAAVWFALAMMSYSIIAGLLFVSVGLTCFKMIQYQYQFEDSKKDESRP